MLEFLFCSMITILPDWLYRRFKQGKRWGQEITIYTLWYELRWGLTTCLLLTLSLITVVFYYHPSTTNVISYFRTVTVVSEGGGRVAEVYIKNEQYLKKGDPIFRLDGASQEAAAATARARISEIDALIAVSQSELDSAEAIVDQAEAALEQSLDEQRRKVTLFKQNSPAVTAREVERLENTVAEREGALEAALSNQHTVETRINTQYPAQKDSAEASLNQAETEIDKLTVVAGVDGQIQQFDLQVGDYVNPLLRPAGILIPKGSGVNRFQAGFAQINRQVIHEGMLAEITCLSSPMRIVPMVVVLVQDVIPAGQFRPTDRLVDIQEYAKPGTVTVALEPLYPNTTAHIPPGSKCIANLYTNNHDRLGDPDVGTMQWIALHAIDAVGIAHAAILRIQALLLPVNTLVLSGH
ncbi:HlyD family secretion protein [Shimia sagamensis]|uniref:Multidrug resistance efflux pump n=1 Tax=Shimia sagamensis TaxID=1566352 RepID=A0ABY1NKI8_9RHOB|nr:biotin/lipoyl-binding protein [Shimia sagamensis]SMP11647.1 Multidrug resistance efflux pump [Shimia sagamensis]